MDPTTNTPAEAQPQGDGQDNGIGSTPWNLDAHPEELRPFLAAELKKIEGGITQKFQEAADFRRQMEPLAPFAEIEGLTDVPGEELQELLQFRQLIQDPQQFEEWWSSIGEELGFFAGDDGDDPEAMGDDAGGDEPPAWAQTLMERLDALEGTTRQSEAERREAQAIQKIEADLGALREQHGDFDEDAVCSLAMAYDDEDAIQKGFADYQRITGKAQSELVDEKANTPGGTPVSGGQGGAAPESVTSFSQAKELAKARFASAR